MSPAILPLLLALGANSSTPEPYPSAFGPGETCTYLVSYLGIEAGTAAVTVGAEAQQGGRRIWPIVTLAATGPTLAFFPVRDRFVTFWDAEAHRTQGSDFVADENHKHHRQQIHIAPAGLTAQVIQEKDGKVAEHTEPVAFGTQDVATAIFALRNQPLAVGKVFQFPIFTGDKSFLLEARVADRETLVTPLGVQEVFRVRMQTQFTGKLRSKSDLFAYFTVDSAHVPLRIESEFVLGTVRADLTQYSPGNVSIGRTGSQPAP